MSNAALKSDFAKILKKAGDKADMVVRKTALELQKSMVQMSPVDTGRFKGNWQAGIGSMNTGTGSSSDITPLGEYDPSKALNTTQTVLEGWKPGQTIWLTNSMAYANRLEYGWSKQAASGMVRLSVQNFAASVKKSADSIK